MRRITLLSTIAAGVVLPATPIPGEEIGWRSAVDRLTAEKTLAESCAAILKAAAVDHPMARVQGERLYVRAKADADGLIALLVADVTGDRSPAAIPELRQRLEAVPRQRQALCRHVGAALSDEAARRASPADLIARGMSSPDASLVEAAGTLWSAYRKADPAEREAIDAAISAAHWRPYALLPPR